MTIELFLTVVVEASEPQESEAVFDAVVARLNHAIATRHETVEYPKIPGSRLGVVELALEDGDDAGPSVTALAHRLGSDGWDFDIGEAYASAIWARTVSTVGLIDPRVRWVHVEAALCDPHAEAVDYAELIPDPPIGDDVGSNGAAG